MKKVIVFVSLLFILCMMNVKAVTLPSLFITSENYATGDNIEDDILFRRDSALNISMGDSFQLYAVIAHGNDLWCDGCATGWTVDQTNLNNVTWKVDNTSIATINENGLLTGLKKGPVTVTVTYAAPEDSLIDSNTASIEFEIVCSTNKGGCSKTVLSFNTNGGSSIKNQNISTCPIYDLDGWFYEKEYNLPTPTKEGYIFDGWYADKNLTIAINDYLSDKSKLVLENHLDENSCPDGNQTTLYAKWKKIEEEPKVEKKEVEVDDTKGKANNLIILSAIFSIVLGITFVILNKRRKKINN